MTTENENLPATTAEDIDRKRRLALLKAVGLDRVSPEQREITLAIAKRYDLDLMLRHVILVEGRPYLTRDGLLHIAHRSGQLDGIEVTEPVLQDGFWRATASVYRRDMTRPFTYYGRYPEKGRNKDFGPEMATKVAEVMALRRAFDVSAPVAEERWDRDLPEPPVAPQTLAERVAQKRNVLAANHETPDPPEGYARTPEEKARVARLAALANEPTPAQVEDGEPEPDEALLGDPMTVDASTAMPSLCGASDAGLDTGECEQLAGHSGPHRNAGGVWPNR